MEEDELKQFGSLIEDFYDKLWKLYEDAALTINGDEIALKILNAIDNALER